MNIEDIDFAPFYYNYSWGLGERIISIDECRFFDFLFSPTVPHGHPGFPIRSEVQYRNTLAKYYERFNNHMPIELRKQFLREYQKESQE